jgi:hypothetical protein
MILQQQMAEFNRKEEKVLFFISINAGSQHHISVYQTVMCYRK